MTAATARAPRLQATGALRDDALYVERPADTELLTALQEGEFCSVLAPRQIGKSSLRVRVARRLREAGVHCAQIDLTTLGHSADRDPIGAWYFSLMSRLARELRLADPKPFAQQHADLLPVERLGLYLRTQMLEVLDGPVVIFLDEIDYLRVLPIDRDEFFVAIRGLYNDRAIEPALGRLTFCLLGVAAPRDLVQNPTITPFNIGRAVHLEDFSRQDLASFSSALSALGGDAADWLDGVYRFTAGHPYMAQALCHYLLSQRSVRSGPIASQVEQAVVAKFLRNGRSSDDNLSYAEKRLQQSPIRAELLALYRALLENGLVTYDTGDPVQQELLLCGMAASQLDHDHDQRTLRVRNAIFAQVFDLAWVREKESRGELQLALQRWINGGRLEHLLLRGPALAAAQQWVREHSREATTEQNDFVLVSLDVAQRDAEAQRTEIEIRGRRRIYTILLLAVFASMLFSTGIYWQYERAESSAAVEKSLRASALASQPESQIQALVSAMEAAQSSQSEVLGPAWEGLCAASAVLLPSQIFEGQAHFAHWPGSVEVLVQTLSPDSGHSDWVNSAAFSPDGKQVITGSVDGRACIWDLATMGSLRCLAGNKMPINSAQFSPDGKQAVTACTDRTARVWDAEQGSPLVTLVGHHDRINTAAFSPDGARIVTASADGTVGIWNVAHGTRLHSIDTAGGWVFSAAFSHDGTRVVAGTADGNARIWDAESGQLILILNATPGWSVRSVSFSRDSKLVLTASQEGSVILWDAVEGTRRLVLDAQSDSVWFAALSADSQLIAAASADRVVRIWDVRSGALVRTLAGHSADVFSVDFSPDGQRLVTAGSDGTARLWNLRAETPKRELVGDHFKVFSACFSPDGKRVLTAGANGCAVLWDVEKGIVQKTMAGHRGWVSSAAFSHNGKRIVTAGADGLVKIWDPDDGRQLLTLSGHKNWVTSASYSPDDQRIATASTDFSVGIWDAKNGQPLHSLLGHTGDVLAAAWSPDGKQIATASFDQTVKIWDSAQGRVIHTLLQLGGRASAVAWSPDGERIVASTIGHPSLIWDAQFPTRILAFQHNTPWDLSSVFSPDGHLVASAGADGTLRIITADSGRLLLRLPTHHGKAFSVGFSPDGKRLVSAGSDGRVVIWTIDPGLLYDFGCQILSTLRNHPDVPPATLSKLLSSCFKP